MAQHCSCMKCNTARPLIQHGRYQTIRVINISWFNTSEFCVILAQQHKISSMVQELKYWIQFLYINHPFQFDWKNVNRKKHLQLPRTEYRKTHYCCNFCLQTLLLLIKCVQSCMTVYVLILCKRSKPERGHSLIWYPFPAMYCIELFELKVLFWIVLLSV